MTEHLYPWGGRFVKGDVNSCVAVVTLSEELDLPREKVAVYGNMKTENLGVEKVVGNVVSNPNIRYLVVCGTEVKGHRSGESLICLHKNGVDDNRRVLGAKSAIPYIENLPAEAIKRFQKQVEVVDLVGVSDREKILVKVEMCLKNNPGSFGEPLIVEPVSKEDVVSVVHAEFSLHSDIDVDLYGVVAPAPEAG